MAKPFAIIHTWPELKNAEYEVLQRMLAAAANINRSVIVVDNDGLVIWASPALNVAPGDQLDKRMVEFAISLHFESPRMVDVYSYYALWQPLSFYFDFGYEKSVDKFLSHNDLLSCDSDVADAHAMNLFASCGRAPKAPLPTLFHAVPQPYLEPRITADSRLFYIGINWERIGRPKGRFHDALVALDDKGLISIYGPEKMFGVAPWEGFKNYEGELPFDGRSVKSAINRAGICLALSSAAHREAGIMSNRLFEGFAGGAAVIATPNPLIDKHFRDCVYLVDDSRGEDVLGQQVLEAVREIRNDTAEATRRTLEGQRRMRDVCSLEGSVERLYQNHPARVAHYERMCLAEAEVAVVLIDEHGLPERLATRVRDYAGQSKCRIALHVVAGGAVVARLSDTALLPVGSLVSIDLHPTEFQPAPASLDGIAAPSARSGATVHAILRETASPYFMIAGGEDMPFSDHVASLAKALEDDKSAMAACSGMLRQTGDVTGRKSRVLDSLHLTDLDTLARVTGSVSRGRFLFRTELVKAGEANVMALLDGQEHRFFQLAALLHAPIAQSGYASYLRDEAVGVPTRAASIPPEIQHQYVRDAFIGNPRYLALLARTHAAEEKPPSIRWSDYAAAPLGREPLKLDRMLSTGLGGEGLRFLTKGFSNAEEGHIWITGDSATFDFSLPPAASVSNGEHEVVLLALGRRSRKTGRDQHCTILLNGMAVAYVRMPESPTDIRISIPRGLLANTREFRMELFPDHNEPAWSGDNDDDSDDDSKDPRHLSIMIKALGLMSASDQNEEMLLPAISYPTGAGKTAEKVLVRGFYAAEPTLTWIAGREGHLRFRLALCPPKPLLRIGVWGRQSDADDAAQEMMVAVNGTYVGTRTLSGRPETLDISLADVAIPDGRLQISIAARHAEAVFDGEGQVVDSRLLGLALTSIGVFSGGGADPFEEDEQATDRLGNAASA